jgi:hypothetical protein
MDNEECIEILGSGTLATNLILNQNPGARDKKSSILQIMHLIPNFQFLHISPLQIP